MDSSRRWMTAMAAILTVMAGDSLHARAWGQERPRDRVGAAEGHEPDHPADHNSAGDASEGGADRDPADHTSAGDGMGHGSHGDAAAHPSHGHGQQAGHDPVMMRMMAIDPDHARGGSGTAWHPASTPMAALATQAGSWVLMGHGAAWLTYNHLESPRGRDQLVSQNWLMLMGMRPLLDGGLTLRGMFSLEALTVGGAGYPLLFQTGETWEGRPLLDVQHPHDLFMELAASYSRPLGRSATAPRLSLYLAPVGEPALGPEAFMHRRSSLENPLAPLGHHWQDATHITWGVVTLGLSGRVWKLEASAFNGREPDEDRWRPDPLRLDSASARAWFAPDDHWAIQLSAGYLNDPERLEPGDVISAIGSAQYNRPLPDGNLSATLVASRKWEEHAVTSSLLLEADWTARRKNHLFTRLEVLQKPGLFLEPDPRHHEVYPLGAATLGYSRDLFTLAGISLAVGAEGQLFAVPEALHEDYGALPWGAYGFVRIRPREQAAMHHGGS